MALDDANVEEEVMKLFVLFTLLTTTLVAHAAEEVTLLKRKGAGRPEPALTGAQAAGVVRQCLRYGITPSQLNALAKRYPDYIPRALSRAGEDRPKCSQVFDCTLADKPSRATAEDVLSVLMVAPRRVCVGDRCMKRCTAKGEFRPVRYEWTTVPARCPETAQCKIRADLECDEDGEGDLALGTCGY